MKQVLESSVKLILINKTNSPGLEYGDMSITVYQARQFYNNYFETRTRKWEEIHRNFTDIEFVDNPIVTLYS